MNARALAGTREGYRRCARCLHMALRHLEAGTGPCGQVTTKHKPDASGRMVTTQTRCTCPRFTTDEELF